MPAQSIRPSQYITTYGPGSILEGPEGPRIVLDLEHSGVFGQQPVMTYAIQEAGLSAVLPDQAQIVRLPTNAERQVRDSQHIYETVAFPRWSLCTEPGHNILYSYQSGSNRTGCPQCGPLPHPAEAWRRSRREAIRFVMACPEGHLDDVNWVGLIKHKTPGCSPGFLRWVGGGGALRNITIICPDCGEGINLGAAYASRWRCSGSYPDRGIWRQGCNRQDARIMQRGAANLYVSELETAVTIPRLDTTLHQALASNQVRPMLQTMQKYSPIQSGAQLRAILNGLFQDGSIPAVIINEVEKYNDDTLFAAMGEVLSTTLPKTSAGIRLREFRELQRAATHGHPSQPSLTPGAPPLFEVIASRVERAIQGPGGHLLRVTPVSRLRVVMVQMGYRRLVGDTDSDNQLVPSVYIEGQNRWLPGVELHGEGVFIDLASAGEDAEQAADHFPLTGGNGQDVAGWLAEWNAGGKTEDTPTPHPVFVWWHTLSHRLLLALAVDSGYSSAAVRERVYFRYDPASGAATGGVLLYTAQPGGDGTLGGLIALVPRFERVLRAALRNVDSCSNDPLCNEERYQSGRSNGAACYACSFVSETSCEFRNMYLDRNILRDNLP